MSFEFTKHQTIFNSYEPLFKYELESKIRKFAFLNNLLLPSDFGTSPIYEIFHCEFPDQRFNEYKIIFLARIKTPDDILGEQLEYQIKNLES